MPERIPVAAKSGFTLIELIVVVSLISITLFFAVPRLDRSFITDDSRKFSGWLISNVTTLKSEAVKNDTVLALYVDLDENRVWKGPAAINDDEPFYEGKPEGVTPPEGIRLTAVIFPGQVRVTDGIARIRFYPRGYSDRAIIRARKNDGSRQSYRIEPFLPRAVLSEDYEEF